MSMKRILVCSYDPLFVKSLYGVLRSDGFGIKVTDHAAHAVQTAFHEKFSAVILDSGSIGLSAIEAAQIIKSELDEMPVIIAGDKDISSDALTVRKPVDIEEVRKLIQKVCAPKSTERREVGL
jgi:DNA-binding NtrC family response regulator